MEYLIEFRDHSFIRICGNTIEDCKRQFQEHGLDQNEIIYYEVKGKEFSDPALWYELEIKICKERVETAKKKVEAAKKDLKYAVQQYNKICKNYGKQSNS